MKKSSLFIAFMKESMKDYLLFIAFILIFGVLFFLYDLSGEAYLYAVVLCVLLMCIIKGIVFFKLCKKHRQMQIELQSVPLLSDAALQADTICEADLINIILKLQKTLNRAITKWEEKEKNAMDFYSTWVHQIKTPVAVLRMILQKEDTKRNRNLLLEVFRIEQYINMVLSYLRLDRTSSDFVFKECKLDDILKAIIHKFAPQFIEKKIMLQYDETKMVVLTDEKWLSFMIEQIVSNALKYTPEGGRIAIKSIQDEMLQISDTGIGIASEDLPRIFEKGFTGYNGRADKKATGLGLYLCKETAKKLSHSITADSIVGKGTTISIGFTRRNLEILE